MEAYPLGTPAGLLAAMAAPLTSLRSLGPQIVPWGVSNDLEDGDVRTREALKFVFSPEGAFFRDFLMEEVRGNAKFVASAAGRCCKCWNGSSTFYGLDCCLWTVARVK